jgi:hypothetical protein
MASIPAAGTVTCRKLPVLAATGAAKTVPMPAPSLDVCLRMCCPLFGDLLGIRVSVESYLFPWCSWGHLRMADVSLKRRCSAASSSVSDTSRTSRLSSTGSIAPYFAASARVILHEDV